MTSDLSWETVAARRQNFIHCEISFKNKCKINTFSDKLKLTEFAISRSTLQEMLKKVFQAVGK